MTAYRFRAARPDGEMVLGTLDAPSTTAAGGILTARGLLPVELAETEPPAPTRARSTAELAEALGGLAALLDAGLPADRALAAAAQAAPPRLAIRLEAAYTRVHEGASLAAAFEASGAVSPLALGLIRAGERSGRLAAAVARAAQEMEQELEARARLRAALTYPAFIGAAGAASVIAITGFVVPRFAVLLGEQGRALPVSTRLLLSFAQFTGAFGPWLLVGTIVACLGLGAWIRTPAGARAGAAFLLELPLVGTLRLRFATSRVCAALGSLLDAGVPMLAALTHARAAADDPEVARRIAEARAEVERGERLAGALARHRALSPAALRLTGFGESSGRLAQFLGHAARLESAAAHRAVQHAITLLEPALILLFGAIVAFVATALFQAIYSVRPGM